MIPKLIRLGIEALLKIVCEKITIKNIEIVKGDEIFNGEIDEISIKAEGVIFNKINISDIKINISDITLNLGFNKKFFIDNCYAAINMRLTKDNINKTLFNNKWKRLKTSIESFIAMSFESIDINNKSIYFYPQDEFSNKKIDYTFQYDKNSILLVNKINQEKLLILNDKNISIEYLYFFESQINLGLSSKIKIN